jgi:hypothetical protein
MQYHSHPLLKLKIWIEYHRFENEFLFTCKECPNAEDLTMKQFHYHLTKHLPMCDDFCICELYENIKSEIKMKSGDVIADEHTLDLTEIYQNWWNSI